MWLLVAVFIGALSTVRGLLFADTQSIHAHHDLCVAKIISCDYYRHSFSLYEEKDIGMFTNIEDLKKACKQQVPYIRCIAQAEKFCEPTVLLPDAEEMIKNRRFTADMCRPPSHWQQLYLREASCLNAYSRRALVFCMDKKIGIGRLKHFNNLELGCKYGTDIIECTVIAIQDKCGYYAGHILKKFLKFHSLSDYKCLNFKVDVDTALNSAPNYDIMEAMFNILEIPHNKPREGNCGMKIADFKEPKLDPYEDGVSEKWLPKESVAAINFDHIMANEIFKKTEDFFSDSFNFDVTSESITLEPTEFDFPALPKHDYIYKNKTTFALYEDEEDEMEHMKYRGCGEADIFWVVQSPLKSKYCSLMDLKSEFSETLFKCTIHIDSPCSLTLEEKDVGKNVEVSHGRYMITVLSLNNQMFEYMAVMNLHYSKMYPYSSLSVQEKKVNLWIEQANKATIDEIVSVSRKGSLVKGDIHYQHGNGSGQKKFKDIMKYSHHVDEDEYYEENENWDYYPLEDEDIYFPESLKNDIIYIEDNNGELISLHDHRSPIYSNSLYQPHAMFRPRFGEVPVSIESQKFENVLKNNLIQSSTFVERSELKDKISYSTGKVGHQEYCTKEKSCSPNSETLSKFAIKPGMHLDIRNIKKFDNFEGLNLETPKRFHFTKSEEIIGEERYLDLRETYVVTPSAKILRKSTDSTPPEKKNKFGVDYSKYAFVKKDYPCKRF